MSEQESDASREFESKFTAEDVRDTRCGFCGKAREEVAQLIVGLTPEIAICNECTEWCWEIVSGSEVSTELLNAPQN